MSREKGEKDATDVSENCFIFPMVGVYSGFLVFPHSDTVKGTGLPNHPVHFWPKLNGAMRRVLVPNLSATFHALRTKFVHDLKVSL